MIRHISFIDTKDIFNALLCHLALPTCKREEGVDPFCGEHEVGRYRFFDGSWKRTDRLNLLDSLIDCGSIAGDRCKLTGYSVRMDGKVRGS